MSAKNATIGALRVELGLDSAQFSEGLKQSQAKLGSFGKNMAGIGVAVGAAFAGIAVAVTASVKSTIDAADALEETAQKIGVGVTELSRLKYAAEISGVSLDSLTTALKKLGANMDDVAAGGTGKAAEALERLGISVHDASGALKSSDQVLVEIAGKFEGMRDGATKTALAMALFGKSGSDLIPLLNEGSAGIAALTAEADRLGITLDSNTAAAAGKFNENLDRLKAVGAGLTTQLTAAMLPALESITAGMLASAQNANLLKSVGQTLGGVLKVLATAGVVVGGVFAELGYILASTVNAALRALVGDFAGARRELEWGGKGMVDTFRGSANALKGIWASTGSEIRATAGARGEDLAAPAIEGAKKTTAAVKQTKDALTDLQKAQKDAATYIAGLQTDLGNRGLSGDQVKAKEALAKASEFLTKGLTFEAMQAARLADTYLGLEANERKVIELSPSFVRSQQDLGEGMRDVGRTFAQVAEDMADQFYDVQQSIEGAFYAAAGNDWVGAFTGIAGALKKVSDAFKVAGDSAGKYAAVAGAVSGVGNAIGGKVGGALSGAASGALAGAQLGSIVPGIGNVVGAAIGGILGGLGGLFGGSSAKKKAKREAQERARLEAERKAADLAAAKRELELRVMELQGDAAGALAARRSDELAAMDASLRVLQEQTWALEDQAAAAETANQLVAQRRELERQMMEALGDTEGAMQSLREDALAALPESLRGLQQAIYGVIDANDARARSEEILADLRADSDDKVAEARAQLSESYEREADALRDTAATFRGLADGLKEFGDSLSAELTGGSAAALGAEFQRIAGLAKLGNVDALGALPDVGRQFLDSQKAGARTLADYLRSVGVVRGAVSDAEATAGRRASIAEQQLASLTAQVNALLGIKTEAVNISAGIAAVNAALAYQTAVQAVTNEQVAEAITRTNSQAAAIAELSTKIAAMAKDAATTANVLQRVTRDGDGMVVAA